MAYSNGYTYRRLITQDHTKISGAADLTSFAVPINGTYSYLAVTGSGGKVTNASGFDIRFESTGGTQLNHQVEKWVSTTGEFVAWVNVPTLTFASDYTFYIYYGNASVSTTEEHATATWDSTYEGVWHFGNGTTLSGADSTTNARNGTLTNSPTASAGQVDGAGTFNGTNQYVTLGNVIDVTTGDLTVEFWMNAANAVQDANIISKLITSSPFTEWSIGQGTRTAAGGDTSSKQIWMFFYGSSLGAAQSYHTTADVANGAWRHVVGRRTSGVVTIWVDGASAPLTADIANTTPPNTTNTGNLIFAFDGNSGHWTGSLDEVRISKASRSNGYITTNYNAQSSPSTFYSVGSETTSGVVNKGISPAFFA